MTQPTQSCPFIKPSKLIAACLLLPTLMVALLAIAGCATTKEHSTESMLSAAGFHTLTPATPQQKACYGALPPYKVQRREINGKVVYAYADKRDGIVYVGGENEYQRFKQLGQQQKIADEQLQAAQMNDDAAMNWGFWGAPGMWW
jgi:hypothetical protein